MDVNSGSSASTGGAVSKGLSPCIPIGEERAVEGDEELFVVAANSGDVMLFPESSCMTSNVSSCK